MVRVDKKTAVMRTYTHVHMKSFVSATALYQHLIWVGSIPEAVGLAAIASMR